MNDKETEGYHFTLALLWGQEGILYGWRLAGDREGGQWQQSYVAGLSPCLSIRRSALCTACGCGATATMGLGVVRKEAGSKGKAGTLTEKDPLEAQKMSLVPSSPMPSCWRL